MLNTFVTDEQKVVLNTSLKLPARRLYIWKLPADKPYQIKIEKIDLMVDNKHYRNIFTAVKTYPSVVIRKEKLKNPTMKKQAKQFLSGKLKRNGHY